MRPTDACPASAYMLAADATQSLSIGAIRDDLATIEDYVLIADVVRIDDNPRELLVLVRLFSFQT